MKSSDEVGFVLTSSFFVDQDTQQQVQITCNAPIGSTAVELAQLLATCREAAWSERIAANDRILARAEAIKSERAKKIAEARAEGAELNEEDIAEEDARINAAFVKVASEAAADRAATSNGHGA